MVNHWLLYSGTPCVNINGTYNNRSGLMHLFQCRNRCLGLFLVSKGVLGVFVVLKELHLKITI